MHFLTLNKSEKFYSFFKKQYMEGPLVSFSAQKFATYGYIKLPALDVSKWDCVFESSQADIKNKLIGIVADINKVNKNSFNERI
jgi:hypothetical protein